MCCGCGGGSHKANCNFNEILAYTDANAIAQNWYHQMTMDQPYDCIDNDYLTYMLNSPDVKLNPASPTRSEEWTNTCYFMRYVLASKVDDYGNFDALVRDY